MFEKYLCRRFSEKDVTVGVILQNTLGNDPFVLCVAIIGAWVWVVMCAEGVLPTWFVILAPVVGVVFGVFMCVVGVVISRIVMYFLNIKVAKCPLKKEK